MTNYYLKENNLITQSANFKFDKNCLETEEEIVRDSISGQLYLASDYTTLQATDAYKAQIKKQTIQAAKATRDSAINEITNAKLLDELQLDAGQITQAIYDARKTARLAQLAQVQTDFYTATGLTQPTTITA